MRLVDYLMSKPLYLGVRVEIANRFLPRKNLIKQYNKTHTSTQLFDLYQDGKITVEKNCSMLIARGAKNDKGKSSGLVNFSVMAEINKMEEARRVIQIVNVLGNDRLIREKVSVFVSGRSILNALPELAELKLAFKDLDSIMPGFIKSGWYYAPEAIL